MEKNKVKVDFTGAADIHNEKEIEAGGVKITLRDHIPLAQKVEMANEIVNAATMIDDETFNICKNHLWDIMKIYLAVKYYTDVDTEGTAPTAVCDWAFNTGAWDKVWGFAYDDVLAVEDIADRVYGYVESSYKKEHGLDTAVLKTFGSILSGEDILDTIDKSREVSEEMLDVAEQLGKASQTGTVKIGGNVIQIGKKNK